MVKNGLAISFEFYGAVEDIKKQKFYEGGFQIGQLLKQVLVPVKNETVVGRQIRIGQRMGMMNLKKYQPWVLVARKVRLAVQQNGVEVGSVLSSLGDILKGILEGLMHLQDTPDFVGCVVSGLTAKKFF